MTHEIDTHYDAVVVGTGTAGAATAMLLARAGRRVLAVDDGARRRESPSTRALGRGAVEQLSRFGLLEALEARGTPRAERLAFHYAGREVSFGVRAREGVEALYAPRRDVLEALLVDAARSAGADVLHGVSLEALERDPSGRVEGAVLRMPNRARVRVPAGIVIGADGVRSAVARAVGARRYRVGRGAAACVSGHFAGIAGTDFRWYYAKRSAAGVLPTNDGATCVLVALAADRFRRDLAGGLTGAFRRALGKCDANLATAVENARPLGHLCASPGTAGYFRESHGPGWALVGDAGLFEDPLTAHGSTAALRDAELLTRAVLRGGDDALAEYQSTRDRLSEPIFELTDEIARLRWSVSDLETLHGRLAEELRRESATLATLDRRAANRAA